MSDKPVFIIAELATEVHQRVATEDLPVSPIFEIRQTMRSGNFPADLLTIDCRQSMKRIVCVFHDQMPDVVLKENGFIEKDLTMNFEEIPLASVDADMLYQWITDYFL